MLKKISFCMLTALLLPLVANGGGWSVVTVEEWPEAPRVGTPVELRFAVRAHGRTLAGGMEMTVVAHHAESDTTLSVRASDESGGYYQATLPLNQAGTWTWRIEGYGTHPMPDLEIKDPVATAQPTCAERLFVSKGCITCHANRTIAHNGINVAVGPDLTDYRADPSFLTAWLADPQSVRPASYMPNLELDAREIEVLVAYLGSE